MQTGIESISACIVRAQEANASQQNLQAAAQAFEQVERPDRNASLSIIIHRFARVTVSQSAGASTDEFGKNPFTLANPGIDSSGTDNLEFNIYS